MPVMLRRARRREGLAQQRCWQVEQAVHRHRCSVTTRAEVSPTCSLASVLPVEAASARDFLNAGALEAVTRGRDLLKLAHCRTDSSPGTCEF